MHGRPCTGVTALAICPGSTETGFFDAAGAQFVTGSRPTPDQILHAALRAIRRRKQCKIPDRRTKLPASGLPIPPPQSHRLPR